MATGICRAAPFLFSNKFAGFEATAKSSYVSKIQKEVAGLAIHNSRGWAGNFVMMTELRKKILTFRDVIDLPPCDGSGPINELVMGTVEDLHKLYPKIIPRNPTSGTKESSLQQELYYLYNALKSIGDSWAKNHKWMAKFGCNQDGNMEEIDSEQFGERLLAKLDYMIKVAREMFDVMDEDEPKNDVNLRNTIFGDILSKSYSDNKTTCSTSPVTPTSILPEQAGEFADVSYSPPLLLPLRLQAVGKLKPIDIKRLSFHMPLHISNQASSPVNNMEKRVDESNKGIQEAKSTSEPMSITVSSTSPQPLPPPMPVAKKPTAVSPPPPPMLPTHVSSTSQQPPPPPPMVPTHVSSTSPQPPPPPSMLPANVSSASSFSPPPPPPPPPSMLPANVSSASSFSPPPPPPPLAPKTSLTVAPPPPPMPPSKGSAQPPPTHMALAKGAAPPPPPPLSVAKALRAKKPNTKLQRSTHLGNLYRILKGKVEGSSLDGKSRNGKKSQIGGGGAAGGKQGMADALAEITKRSAYFQQIEEDVQKHAKSIMELKAAITKFQTKDMAELLKFHKYVELQLEELTDETQVLARFEDFPTKKLETLRIAAALHTRLNSMVTTLESWKVAAPLGHLLDSVDCYFNKIKGEVDAMDRSKDEESKRFQSHNIHFDFNILVRIKESIVDVSSGCMELALKERREAKAAVSGETGSKNEARSKACVKMLWKAFQLAFRVYTFAGGHDDRADWLTRELAHEIENDPQHQ